MEAIKLNANNRTVIGKQVKQLRAAGKLPAVIYGHGLESRSVELSYAEFEKAYKAAGWSSLLDLAVEGGAPLKVLIQDAQQDPLTDKFTHVDLREVNMKEKLETEVMLRFVGESPAVKELGAVLVKNADKIKVRCLPSDLVHEIDVDLSKLKGFGDRVSIKDIVPPSGVEFISKTDDALATVIAPISEEELKALDTAVVEDVAAVKVESEEKKKAEEAAKAEAEKAAE